MADQFDIASDLEEMDRAAAINAARKLTTVMKPVKLCYNCEADLPPDKLFCDDDCRDDWQHRNPNK